MIKNLILVGFGGGVGSILRYLCQRWINEPSVQSFPFATFFVNILGCFLIGVLYTLADRAQWLTPHMRLLLMVGFCGGFTTFSTFAIENMMMMRIGDHVNLFLYITGSVVLGIGAVYTGMYLTKLI